MPGFRPWRAVSSIACGHLASMAVVAVAVAFRLPLDRPALQWGAGVLLLVALACRLLRGHALAGQLGMALWSFIMSTAHGAGFVLMPSLMTVCGRGAVGPALIVLGAMGIHMALMLAANGVIAYIAFFLTRNIRKAGVCTGTIRLRLSNCAARNQSSSVRA